MKQSVLLRITCFTVPYKTGIRLLGVALNPADGFPARLLVASLFRRETLHAAGVVPQWRRPGVYLARVTGPRWSAASQPSSGPWLLSRTRRFSEQPSHLDLLGLEGSGQSLHSPSSVFRARRWYRRSGPRPRCQRAAPDHRRHRGPGPAVAPGAPRTDAGPIPGVPQ